MKSAISNIDPGRISKLLCSAFLIAGALIWLLTDSAHATPSHIANTADDALSADAHVFDLVQAKELQTNLPASLGEIISTVPESLKLDLSIRVNRVFRLVFEADVDGNQNGEPLILIDEDKGTKLADLPESLMPAGGEKLAEEPADSLGWSIFEGDDVPLIRGQMYRTDI
jgi:hypothetical protein